MAGRAYAYCRLRVTGRGENLPVGRVSERVWENQPAHAGSSAGLRRLEDQGEYYKTFDNLPEALEHQRLHTLERIRAKK